MKNKILIWMVLNIFIFANMPLVFGQAAPAGGAAPAGSRVSSIGNLISATGNIVPDVENNSIMVVDYPHNISAIEDYLKMSDIPSRQVLIETKVVEVQLSGEHSLGVNWSLLADKNARVLGAQVYSYDNAGTRRNGVFQNLAGLPAHWNPINGDVANPFNLGIFSSDIDVLLEMLATTLKANVISAPQVTTTNNRRAKIDVVRTIPYISGATVTPATTTNGVTTPAIVTYSYANADEGVSMDVVPLINNDESITLSLFPQVKEIVKWDVMPTPAEATREIQMPEVDVRSIQTKVTVRSGQTLVIGGLIREKHTEGDIKVPFFGDIPLLGKLFRNSNKTKDKVELLILVSPVIVTPELMSGIANRGMELAKGENPDTVLAPARKKAPLTPEDEQDWSRVMARLDGLQVKMQDVTNNRESLQKEIEKAK